MQERCFRNCTEFESSGGILSGSLRRLLTISREVASELANIKTCPASCDNGMVEVFPASLRETYGPLRETYGPIRSRKAPCPIISPDCACGIKMARGLERFLAGVMAGIGVPLRHLENFDRLRDATAVLEACKWSMRGMLIFCGKPGTGKSFGAAVAVREYLKSRVPNVLDRKTWANAKKAATAVVWCGAMELTDGTNTALRAKKEFLAVIDDLGREDSSGNTLAAIRGVISKRYDSKLPTVITTELTMTDISARYGRYILEKIIEDIEHGGKIIDCGDVSTRMMDGGKKKA